MIFELVQDFSDALAAMPKEHPRRRVLELYEEAVRRDIHFVARHPTTVFQCMWNACWWYDCPEAEKHYVVPEGGWEEPQPWTKPTLAPLLEKWRAKKEEATPGLYWVRSLRPPTMHLGTAQKMVLRGHEREVASVAFSPDGCRIASAESGRFDSTVRIWDAESGEELRVLHGHESLGISVAYSPNGALVAAISGHGHMVRVCDEEGGAERRVLHGGHDLKSVAFSPDGGRIAGGGICSRVWDVESGAELSLLTNRGGHVNAVAFSPDGRRIVGGSTANAVHVWDSDSGAELHVLRGHEASVTSVAFSSDGKRIVSGSDDKTARLWDAQSGAELRVLRGHEEVVSSVAFSPDGRRIVSGSWDETVRVWDPESGAQLRVLCGHESLVRSVTFSPDGRRVVSGSEDKTVRVWDAATGAELRALRDHERFVYSMAFSPNGHLIAAGSSNQDLQVWEVESGAGLRFLRGHEEWVSSVAFSSDGQRIVSGSDDRTVRIWDVASGVELQCLVGHEYRVSSVAFSLDGKRVVSKSNKHHDRNGGSVRLWETDSDAGKRPWFERFVLACRRMWNAGRGLELYRLRRPERVVHRKVYSPNGEQLPENDRRVVVRTWYEDGVGDKRSWFQRFAIACRRIWNAGSWEELLCFGGHTIESVALSPDGRCIAGGSTDSTVRVRDADSGAELHVLRGHEMLVESVSFSPDGRRIVSGSGDKTVRVWDSQSGAELHVLRGHEASVTSVAFSSDGKRIVSGSDDKTARLWDAQSGNCIEVIRGTGDVRAIAGGPEQYPWRALQRGQETALETARNSQPMAWLGEAVAEIATHPSKRIWAGVAGNSLCLIKLEGGE